MKSENDLLEIYDLKGKFLGTQNRKDFYNEIKSEFKKTGKITKKVNHIKLLLLTSEGRLYLQRRSELKKENPNLLDKTIGGHVKAGHSLNLTVVQECHEELGFPAVVLTDEEFESAINTTDLEIIGIFRKIDYVPNFISVRESEDGDFKQPVIVNFYIGYYDGSIKFCDGESRGIEVFSLADLKKKIKKSPDEFAEDLKYMVKRYEKHIVPISESESETVLGYEE